MTLRPISEAARIVERCERTLRDWEHAGLINPLRDTLGRRLYSDGDIERLREIANRPRRGKAPQTAPAAA